MAVDKINIAGKELWESVTSGLWADTKGTDKDVASNAASLTTRF